LEKRSSNILNSAPEFLRLQCEREIKGKLLLLREAFIETEGKGKALKRLIKDALPALIAIFKALCSLKKIARTRKKGARFIKAVADAFELAYAVFEGLLHMLRRRHLNK
jgi:hypothetical protein